MCNVVERVPSAEALGWSRDLGFKLSKPLSKNRGSTPYLLCVFGVSSCRHGRPRGLSAAVRYPMTVHTINLFKEAIVKTVPRLVVNRYEQPCLSLLNHTNNILINKTTLPDALVGTW